MTFARYTCERILNYLQPYQHIVKKDPRWLHKRVLNKKQMSEDLFLFKKIMDQYNVNFWLINGTLLGCIREQNFIEYDEDIDLMIDADDIENFLKTIPELIENKFVCRCIKKYVSVAKNNDTHSGHNIKATNGKYIPYGTTMKFQRNNSCMIDLEFISSTNQDREFYESDEKIGKKLSKTIDNYYKKFIEIDFLGKTFKVPNNPAIFLEKFYGKNWKIPMKQGSYIPPWADTTGY
jgi:phosphorylcholine metabolism protein LicD